MGYLIRIKKWWVVVLCGVCDIFIYSVSSALNVFCVFLNTSLLVVLISLNSRVWSCSVLAITSLLSCCM